MALLTALWARVSPYLTAFAAAIAVAGTLLYAGRRQGRLESETAALRGNADDRRVRDANDLAAARRPDPAAELRDKWARD